MCFRNYNLFSYLMCVPFLYNVTRAELGKLRLRTRYSDHKSIEKSRKHVAYFPPLSSDRLCPAFPFERAGRPGHATKSQNDSEPAELESKSFASSQSLIVLLKKHQYLSFCTFVSANSKPNLSVTTCPAGGREREAEC